jgi:metal-responsive CopG/Arc/MetJ family transcriptional regulator
MKTVQMTLDKDLVLEVDRIASAQGKSRSSFTRDALRAAVESARNRELEEQHRRGYQLHPPGSEDADDWSDWEAQLALRSTPE